MPAPAPTSQVRSYRLLLLLVAAGNLAFWAVHRLDGGALHDPFWVRAAVSGVALAVALLTYAPAAQRAARGLVYAVAHGLVLYATLLCARNGFQPAYAVGYVGLVAALGLGGAATARHAGALWAVMAGAVVAPLVALVLADAPAVGRASFLLSLVSTAGVAALVTHERMRDRAQVAGERARYRSVFEGATDGLYLADVATRRVLDANPAVLRLSGYALAEMQALRIDDLIDVRTGEPTVAHNITAARVGNEIVVGPRRLRTAAGRLVDVDVSATVIDTGNGRETMSVVVRDATERRAAERALRLSMAEADAARARAEELLRLKSSFLSNMSHEIRTPLTGILGYAELLGDETTGDARDMVGAVERSATRLMRTLNSVLDLARLDADCEAVCSEPVDLSAEAHAAAEALQSVAAARGLSLRVAAAGPVWALADAGTVVRVLDNLIGNALKFTAAGGVSVSVAEGDGRAVLRVSDTGPGIAEAFLPYLFDEFRQASNGHGRTHEGSGLGLALVRRLTERHGGAISVESAEGAGSTFTVSFARAEAPATAPAEAPVGAAAGHG